MGKNKVIPIILVGIFALFVSLFATKTSLNPQYISFLMFTLVFIPTLINPDIGFMIIIVSMLFSPDVILGATTRREVTLRVEDVFLLIVILASFLRTTFRRTIMKNFRTSLTKPYLLFVSAALLSSILALTQSSIDIKHSFFSVLKYLQYFFLFLIVKFNLKKTKQIRLFTFLILLTAFLVSFHSNMYINRMEVQGKRFFRTAPPVATRGPGESGTLGGYLTLLIGLSLGLLLYTRSRVLKIILICYTLFLFRAFLFTLSRGSYLAIIAVFVSMVIFSRRILFFYAVCIGAILIIFFAPDMIKKRVTDTFIMKEGIEGEYMQLEQSPMDRIMSWQAVLFVNFPNSPIFGHGVGRHFIDGQIFLTLDESGMLGLGLLVWIWIIVFKMARKVFLVQRERKSEFGQGLAMGFLAGFCGLLAQSVSTNTFIIIRIMEPFWFLVAMVMMLPELQDKEHAEELKLEGSFVGNQPFPENNPEYRV